MRRCAKSARAKPATNGLGEIWETQQAEHPEDWLLSMEIFEILDTTDQQRELKTENRKVPEREESEDERSLDANQLGIPLGRLPQETGIPGDAARFAKVTVAVCSAWHHVGQERLQSPTLATRCIFQQADATVRRSARQATVRPPLDSFQDRR